MFGWMIDRWGVRRVMIPGVVLYALSIASYALIRARPVRHHDPAFRDDRLDPRRSAAPIPYSTVISQWFDRQRGLALGIGMAGVGLGVALMPQVAAFLIGAFRLAHRLCRDGGRGDGAGICPGRGLFVREPPDYAARPERGQSRGGALNLPGASRVRGVPLLAVLGAGQSRSSST